MFINYPQNPPKINNSNNILNCYSTSSVFDDDFLGNTCAVDTKKRREETPVK